MLSTHKLATWPKTAGFRGKMKLYYFDGYGRVEPIRLMLAASNAVDIAFEWDDIRVSMEDWPVLKP